MKTEYGGIEISYDEGRDVWLFELRGRSRSSESLAKAKEAIDKEPKEKRAQTFPRFQAYLWKYSELMTVTVTSLADDNYYGTGKTFWITDSRGKRSKERDHSLFPVNDHNTAVIEKVKATEKEIEALNAQLTKHKERLQKATVPAEIAA